MSGVKSTDSSRVVGGAGVVQEISQPNSDEVSLRDPLQTPETIKVPLPEQGKLQAKLGGNVLTVRSSVASEDRSGVGKRSRYVPTADVGTIGSKERPSYERLIAMLREIQRS